LREIGAAIAQFCAAKPRVPVPDAHDRIGDADQATLAKIVDLLERRTQHEFSVYRRATLLRRIGRPMRLRGSDTLSAYLEMLRAVPEEVRALCEELLVTASEFFRDQRLFEYLAKAVLPSVFDRKNAEDDRVRAWSVGCSTGEEAYSLAMLLLEEAQGRT